MFISYRDTQQHRSHFPSSDSFFLFPSNEKKIGISPPLEVIPTLINQNGPLKVSESTKQPTKKDRPLKNHHRYVIQTNAAPAINAFKPIRQTHYVPNENSLEPTPTYINHPLLTIPQ